MVHNIVRFLKLSAAVPAGSSTSSVPHCRSTVLPVPAISVYVPA